MRTQSTAAEAAHALVTSWRPALLELCDAVRGAARGAIQAALEKGVLATLGRPVAQGAGDITFALDEATERVVEQWLERVARARPLSLLTEDRGWLHRGPGPGGWRELPDFDHGGPRIAIDPIDGTRHLMADLRSAWTIVSAAGAGPQEPRYKDLIYGIAAEIPDSRAARWRRLEGMSGSGAKAFLVDLDGDRQVGHSVLTSDSEARPDHGYFVFFSYHPELRAQVASLAARFFARTAQHEGAELSHCYDDQYISSGGQLALLALTTYRMAVEARSSVARFHQRPTQFAKPYDMAGAALIASLAGCVVECPDGSELDFPLDATTPVDFAGYANRATAARLRPHLQAALREEERLAQTIRNQVRP